jgi:Mn-containing catalase
VPGSATASIAAEEFGHIELVSAAINTMLTGAAEGEFEAGARDSVKGTRNTQQFIAGGAATLVQDSNSKPWNGDYVFSSGDLVEDLTHNFFLETGARNNFQEIAAVFNGPHPETGEDLRIAEEVHPEGVPPFDLPAQPAVFAPGPEPEEIAEIAAKLREAAGLPKEPTGVVANNGSGKVKQKVKDAVS